VKNALPSYRTSQCWREVLAAAKRGDDYYDGGEGNLAFRQYLGRLKQELAHPLYGKFRYVQKPTLVIHGVRDENITHEEAFKIFDELKEAGNRQVTLVIVPGADHSMHIAPPDTDAETHLRERLSRLSYRHPFSEFFIRALIGWMKDQFKHQN
jgi:pimeloyl-ACP methyl ester carboxylesterase